MGHRGIAPFEQMEASIRCGDHIGNLSDGSIVHAFFPFVWKLSGADPSVVAVIAAYGRVGGLSEFEYLYHKNHGQQIDRQSLDEYLDMFTIYKLKVAEDIVVL